MPLAGDLTRAVLEDEVVKRALALEELLRTRSPFALVRAVELAERLLDESDAHGNGLASATTEGG